MIIDYGDYYGINLNTRMVELVFTTHSGWIGHTNNSGMDTYDFCVP